MVHCWFYPHDYLGHYLGKLFLIILSELLQYNLTKVWEEYKTIPGNGVGHVDHLLLHDVQAKGHQGW